MSADSILTDVLTRMFEAHDLPRDGRAGSEQRWYPDLWADLADAGMPWVSLSEIVGGSGGTVDDAFEMLRLAGAYAAPVPLAETSMIGGWMLTESAIALPEGPLAVVERPDGLIVERAGRGWRLSGMAPRVPFGGEVEVVIALCAGPEGTQVVRAPVAAAEVKLGRNLAGEPLDDLVFTDVALGAADVAPAPSEVTVDAVRRRGAAARVAMMSGAIDRVEAMTMRTLTTAISSAGRSQRSRLCSTAWSAWPRKPSSPGWRRRSRYVPSQTVVPISRSPRPRRSWARPPPRSRCTPTRSTARSA